jgi:hypothetical protein
MIGSDRRATISRSLRDKVGTTAANHLSLIASPFSRLRPHPSHHPPILKPHDALAIRSVLLRMSHLYDCRAFRVKPLK